MTRKPTNSVRITLTGGGLHTRIQPDDRVRLVLLSVAVGFVGVVFVSLPPIGEGTSEFGVVLGVAFRGDDVSALELVGVAFVIGGAYLASRRAAG